MIRRALFVAAIASVATVTAVACGQPAPSGLEEPVRVEGAQLVDGELPGTPPGTPGPADLRITSITTASRVVSPGEAAKRVEGRASGRAQAIGLRFADLGTGYWVFPLGAPDPQFPGELSWEAELDFDLGVSRGPGFHPLRVVALADDGTAGEQSEISMCVASQVPDDLSSCDPKTPPPHPVVSLFWDADMDLDLRVGLPNGRTVDPKHPLSDPKADGGAADPSVAHFTRDSIAACQKDGRRQEDLVFPKRPKGSIDVYVQLSDPCRKPAASFTVVVYEADGAPPNRRLVERARENGRLVATLSENESLAPPTYVTSYDFP